MKGSWWKGIYINIIIVLDEWQNSFLQLFFNTKYLFSFKETQVCGQN